MYEFKRFLRPANFDLAFTRVLTSSNGSYKNFFRHYYASYDLARKENLKHLIAEIVSGKYQPSRPRHIYYPKSSGVLRPITLLRVEDQIVYQALLNVVAERFSNLQSGHAFTRTFGALFQGPSSDFFYYDWHHAYEQFNFAIEQAVAAKQDYFSEFDLVSFYELIDHGILRTTLSKRIKSPEFLDFLFNCLGHWTHNKTGELRHGVPQGPAPSAFLAECILFTMDSLKFKGVTYLRYIDDIRILSASPTPIRRALIQLDLKSKALGLVPQAQKITAPRKVADASEITKKIPSLVLEQESQAKLSQKVVRKLFKDSLLKDKSGWRVINPTHFKYSLGRLNANPTILKRVAEIAGRQPELATQIGAYFQKFPKSKEVVSLIHALLDKDPVYDAVAASYVDALDVCDPGTGMGKHLTLVDNVSKATEEKSLLVPLACETFRGRRIHLPKALSMIQTQKEKLVRSLLVERLFRDANQASFNIKKGQGILETMCCDSDPDLSRYAAATLLEFAEPAWKAPPCASSSVARLLFGVGKTSTGPRLATVLDVFFKEVLGIATKMKWKKALGSDLAALEQRCLRVQTLRNGDQTARILIIDTFNDFLCQKFCSVHPSLSGPYKSAAGKKHHPDFGAWISQPQQAKLLPNANAWFVSIHDARIKSDLAHASQSAGGKHTKPITRQQAEKLWAGAKVAYSELLQEWSLQL